MADIAVDFGKEGADAASGFFHNVFASLFGTDMTDAQYMQMYYNQKFNREQADLAYNRQLAMDNTKYQRAVQDAQKAGLNPMVVAGGSLSSPSVQAASSSGGTNSNGVNLGDIVRLISMFSSIRNTNANTELAKSETQKNKAEEKNIDANTGKIIAETLDTQEQTRGRKLYNDFFQDTYELRNILMEDEHERNQWSKEVAYKNIDLQEEANAVVKEQSEHYTALLDAQKEYIMEQKASEPFKRAQIAALTREANQDTTYKAAMQELETKIRETQSEQERENLKILQAEARFKNGVYTPEYIEAVCKEAKTAAYIKVLLSQYYRGDYHQASKGLQKVFKKLESDAAFPFSNMVDENYSAARALPLP